MATLREWINRVHHVGHHSRFEDDLDVEVRFHIESRAAELQGSGLSRADARNVAAILFEIVGDLEFIELSRHPEIGEKQDHQGIK